MQRSLRPSRRAWCSQQEPKVLLCNLCWFCFLIAVESRNPLDVKDPATHLLELMHHALEV
jgi:hypothetical protein